MLQGVCDPCCVCCLCCSAVSSDRTASCSTISALTPNSIQLLHAEAPVKRKRGRPKGSKTKTPKAASKKPVKEPQPNKRRSAYMLFVKANRARVKREHPEFTQVQITHVCASAFRRFAPVYFSHLFITLLLLLAVVTVVLVVALLMFCTPWRLSRSHLPVVVSGSTMAREQRGRSGRVCRYGGWHTFHQQVDNRPVLRLTPPIAVTLTIAFTFSFSLGFFCGSVRCRDATAAASPFRSHPHRTASAHRHSQPTVRERAL